MTGERDIFGNDVDTAALAGLERSGTAWNGGIVQRGGLERRRLDVVVVGVVELGVVVVGVVELGVVVVGVVDLGLVELGVVESLGVVVVGLVELGRRLLVLRTPSR